MMNFLAALLYSVSSAVLIALGAGMARGSLSVQIAAMALSLGALIGILALWQSRRASTQPLTEHEAPGPWGWAAIVLFALFSLRAFLWLIFIDRDVIRVISPNNLGDLSLHIAYIRHLAGGAALWPDNPIYSGAKLTYPLGIDLFNSLLLLAGVDLFRGLIWVGLAGAALTGVALWKWGRAFTLAGFLCNGGLLGLAFFFSGRILDFQTDAAWKSIPLALFVTQRGFLFALPAGLALLCSWRSRFFPTVETSGGPDEPWRLPFWGEVLLYSALPIFHLHTFLFLSFVLGSWFLSGATARLPILRLVGASLVPASALVFLATGQFQGPSLLGWKRGWMQDDQNFFYFWISNFGLLPFFTAALVYRLWKNPSAPRVAQAFLLPALLMFVLCCFVKFATWEWDNTKLMIWSYLVLLPILWDQLISRFPLPFRTLSCTALFFSGLLSLLGGIGSSQRGYDLGSASEITAVGFDLAALPLSATFAAAPAYNHPLLLTGHKLAMGYEGHVWSHGYNWAQRKEDLAHLMNGDENWREMAAQLHVRYVFWGSREDEAFPQSSEPWKTSARCVAHDDWGDLWDLDTPPAQ